jgi:predicted peptidase
MIRGLQRGLNLLTTPGITSVEDSSVPDQGNHSRFVSVNAPRFLFLSFFFLSACVSLRAKRQQPNPADGFLARSYRSAGGETMQYRLFVPPGYAAAKKYPIMLWLHGANGRGSDNLRQISGGNFIGTHVWTSAEVQAKDPVFVLAPQVENTKAWSRPHVNAAAPVSLRLALEILDAVEKEYSIDRDREYIAGQSMGGEGVWAALTLARGRFAAAIVLCSDGFDNEIAPDAKVPVWIFQGESDPIVPVDRVRKWVAALRQAGGSPKYTEVPGVGHNVWDTAFDNPDSATWLLSQRRAK